MTDNYNLKKVKIKKNDFSKKILVPKFNTILQIYSLSNFAYRLFCMGYNVRLEINEKFESLFETIDYYLKSTISHPLDGPNSRGYRFIRRRQYTRVTNGFEIGYVLHNNIDDAVVIIEHNDWPSDENGLFYIVNLDSKLPNTENNDFLGLALNFYCKTHLGAHVIRWSGGIESILKGTDTMKFNPYVTTINSFKEAMIESRYLHGREVLKALDHAKIIYSAFLSDFKAPNFHEDIFPSLKTNKYPTKNNLNLFEKNGLSKEKISNDFDKGKDIISFYEKFIVPLDIVIDNIDFFSHFYRNKVFPLNKIGKNLGIELFLYPLTNLEPILFSNNSLLTYIEEKYKNHNKKVSLNDIRNQKGGKYYKINYKNQFGGSNEIKIFGQFKFKSSYNSLDNVSSDNNKLFQIILKDLSTPYIFYVHMIEKFFEDPKNKKLRILGIVEYQCDREYMVLNSLRELHQNLKFSDLPIINNYLIFSRKDGSMKYFYDLIYDYDNDYLYLNKFVGNRKIKVVILDFNEFDHHLFFVSGYLFF